MISNEHSAAPLPLLAAAVLCLYVVLLGWNVVSPPPPIDVEVFSEPSAATQPPAPKVP